MQVLKLGSKGNDVIELQRKLNLYADGIYGKITEEAVKQFQKDNGLICDGIAGDKTLRLLYNQPYKSYRKINKIILHCSATKEGCNYTVTDIDRWHRQRGYKQIGYHYVIYLDGTIKEGRNIDLIGAHCEGYNTGSIGICYIGGLESDGKTPKDTRTDEQKKSLVKLVKELMNTYLLKPKDVYCHNQFNKYKACPSFNINTFREELV